MRSLNPTGDEQQLDKCPHVHVEDKQPRWSRFLFERPPNDRVTLRVGPSWRRLSAGVAAAAAGAAFRESSTAEEQLRPPRGH